MAASARSPNQIMAMFARKKQKLSTTKEPAESPPQAKEESVVQAAESPRESSYSTHPTYPFPIADFPSSSFQQRALLAPKAIKKGDLDLLYFQPFLNQSCSSSIYKHLLESLPWYKVSYLARGMTINTPRYTTVFGLDETAIWDRHSGNDGGDDGTEIRVRATIPVAGSKVLSAISKQPVPGNVYQSPPRPIPRCLQELKESVELATGESYNFVLVNFYADGAHSISPHADDEPFLGPNPCVASLSLGGTRDFVMKHKRKKEVSSEKFALRSGDMVVMRGTTMANWLHSVPKRVGKTQRASPRVNVTFRKVLNAQGSNNYAHYNVGCGPAHRFVQGAMVPVASSD